MFDTLRVDFEQYYQLLPGKPSWWTRTMFYLTCQGMWAIQDYRFRRWLTTAPRIIRWLLWWPIFFWHIAIQTLTGISLPTACRIGKGLYIGHFSGIFVHDDVIMGEYCSLSQGVSIGLGGKKHACGVPRVGDHVYFGAGAKVLGKITIGSRVMVGANAVVLDSVPDGATAVGIPARVVHSYTPGI